MRILVMGAGAIGSNVGGRLTLAGYDVTLIDQWPAYVDAMKAQGLKLSGTAASTWHPCARSICTRRRASAIHSTQSSSP